MKSREYMLNNDDKSKKVLIVEDDILQQIILEQMVTSMGHTVLAKVSKGTEAIKSALRLDAVDLILMDIKLSDNIDGIEAMSKIRKSSNVKVIYVTGNTEPQNVERAKKTDYVAFLSKPVDKNLLAKALEDAF